MDMSFTRDPDWIHRREALWKETVKKFDIGNGSPQERVERLHTYFLTGELVEGNPRDVRSRLFYFPAMNIEAVEHVLKHNMPDGVNDNDITALKIFFAGGIDNVPGSRTDAALEIFKHVFGETYSPDWTLPFQIGNEENFRTSELNPNPLFAFGASIEQWWRYPQMGRSIWKHLQDYWFSLLDHVDPVLYRPGDKRSSPKGVHRRLTQGQLKSLLGKCAHQIDPSNGAPEGEERRQYMRAFRERMEALTHPDELLALWETVKNTDPEEFS